MRIYITIILGLSFLGVAIPRFIRMRTLKIELHIILNYVGLILEIIMSTLAIIFVWEL